MSNNESIHRFHRNEAIRGTEGAFSTVTESVGGGKVGDLKALFELSIQVTELTVMLAGGYRRVGASLSGQLQSSP
jgi:hypothetical protein